MKANKSFRLDLHLAYEGEISFDELIKRQTHFIQSIANYFSHRTRPWSINESADLYQEACYWLINSIWEWDHDGSIPLDTYVLYNVGARLQNIIRREYAQRRQQDYEKSIWESSNDDVSASNYLLESKIPSLQATPEEIAMVSELLDTASKQFSDSAFQLLLKLIINNGIFIEAVRDLIRNEKFRKKFSSNEIEAKYQIQKRIFPEILSILK